MSKIGEFEDYEVRNMKDDAKIAIDALTAIVRECESRYVSKRYMREKIEKAKWCVNYIAEVVGE